MSKRKAEDDAAPASAGQDSAAADTETAPGQRSGKKGKYRRDKPWDVDGIDHWKPVEYTEEQGKTNPLIEETSFSTLFPKYREHYLRQYWPQVTSTLKGHRVDCVLDLIEGSMTVRTTRKTWDPYIIIKARDFIKLLARSVPFLPATKVLEDEMACDVIKIGNVVTNKERFVKRRQRLIGQDGATLKAIELLTECYILVQGSTVSAIGKHKGIKQVRKVVLDCMNNVHPIYNIKSMMIKRELAQSDELKAESWDRFLPKFKRKNLKKKKVKIEAKKDKPLFPPAPMPSKIDLQLESGEYFLRKEEKAARQRKAKEEAQVKASAKKQEERQKVYEAPKEDAPKKKKKKGKESTAPRPDEFAAPAAPDVDVAALKKKLRKKAPSAAARSAAEYVLDSSASAPTKEKKKKKSSSKRE
eukprot:m.417836 g.417836  ORF g.417836 m.417836 type:complete len:414 (+) comp30638_c0_seq1:179-1420(+)